MQQKNEGVFQVCSKIITCGYSNLKGAMITGVLPDLV